MQSPAPTTFSHQSSSETLCVFGFQRLGPMLKKGNVWYIRHYERYFSNVKVLYLLGDSPNIVAQGATHLMSIGGKAKWLDLALAPWRLFRFIQKEQPTCILTADIIFGWWAFWLARVMGHKLAVMPVCIPEDIYRDTGRSLTGLPMWVERLFLRLTFTSAHTVLTGRCFGAFVQWLSSHPWVGRKLFVVDSLADALPSPAFIEATVDCKRCVDENVKTLICVGRLHKEKLIDDLLHMLRHLLDANPPNRNLQLLLVGDGPERENLEQLAIELGVQEKVFFLGALENEKIPPLLLRADVFVSPLTGTSLREAALCGLPVVAYDRDWLSGLLIHDETALLVPSRDIEGMALQVTRLLENSELADKLSNSSKLLAEKLWTPEAVSQSMAALNRHMQVE